MDTNTTTAERLAKYILRAPSWRDAMTQAYKDGLTWTATDENEAWHHVEGTTAAPRDDFTPNAIFVQTEGPCIPVEVEPSEACNDSHTCPAATDSRGIKYYPAKLDLLPLPPTEADLSNVLEHLTMAYAFIAPPWCKVEAQGRTLTRYGATGAKTTEHKSHIHMLAAMASLIAQEAEKAANLKPLN